MRSNKHLILNSILLLSILHLCSGVPKANCQGTGQVIEDGSGNVFMEEVVDEKQQRKEEAERKRIRRINRRLLSPEEMRNVRIQMAPSGKLVPLINKNPNAPLIRRNVSKLTTEVQPAWRNLPYGYPGMYNPYFRNPNLPRLPASTLPGLVYPGGVFNPALGFPFNRPGAIPYGFARPYFSRPMIGLGSGLMGLGSRTTVTYGGGANPTISQDITMPPGGLASPFLNSFRSGYVPGGHSMSGSFFNPFTGSSSSFDSTVRPISPHFNTEIN